MLDKFLKVPSAKDMHAPGSPLPTSFYTADVGYLVDGTDLVTAGNNAVRAGAVPPAPAAASAPQQVRVRNNSQTQRACCNPLKAFGGFVEHTSISVPKVAAAFVGVSTQASAPVRKAGGFAYAIQKDGRVSIFFLLTFPRTLGEGQSVVH